MVSRFCPGGQSLKVNAMQIGVNANALVTRSHVNDPLSDMKPDRCYISKHATCINMSTHRHTHTDNKHM